MTVPAGAAFSPQGYLTVTEVPQPPLSLFADAAAMQARRLGVTTEEARYRDGVIRELNRLKEGWWNAMLDADRSLLVGSYMDWRANTADGRGQEVVVLRSDDPDAALRRFISHPRLKAMGLDEFRAVRQSVQDYAAQLQAMGIETTFHGRSFDDLSVTVEGDPERLAQVHGDALPMPPDEARIIYDIPPRANGPVANYLRYDPVMDGPSGPYVQPLHMGRIVVEDGCILVENGSGRHLAVFSEGYVIDMDAEGYAALLLPSGTMGVRLGTTIGYSGGGQGAPRSDAQIAACGAGTQLWIPEAQSHSTEGPYNPYRP